MSIGNNIRNLRKDRGLTQKELAEKCDLSRSYIADLERDRYNPSLDSLKIVAHGLGVNVSRLLGEEKNENNKDCDIRKIERARNKMTPKDKEKMMKILEASFEDYFNEN